MKLSRWLILLLALLSAGLLVGAGLAIPNAGSQVTIERKVLAGDPEAADGVERTLPLTCGSQRFWVTTFPAGRPEEEATPLTLADAAQYQNRLAQELKQSFDRIKAEAVRQRQTAAARELERQQQEARARAAEAARRRREEEEAQRRREEEYLRDAGDALQGSAVALIIELTQSHTAASSLPQSRGVHGAMGIRVMSPSRSVASWSRRRLPAACQLTKGPSTFFAVASSTRRRILVSR